MNLRLTRLFAVLGLFLGLSALAKTIPFDAYFDMASGKYKGQTYLAFVRENVKPALDRVATEGYVIRGPKAIEEAYNLSDDKVQNKVKSWGGIEKIKRIAAKLEGQTVTLANLPEKIRAIDRTVDQYDLSTFLGLASGGGVSIRYAEDNYGLNVHYDTEEERSGRSFGVGPTRKANDASDKAYLEDLQEYVTTSRKNLNEFYSSGLRTLLNSDPSNYANVEEFGQTVLTDFLSVFTAEQVRNLMDGHVSPHWDAALMEVTLLAAFHAGQKELKLFYHDISTGETTFTNTTLKQTPCALPTKRQKAALRDYWQFSRNINSEKNCRRSGINITNDEFRELAERITEFTYENNQPLFQEVKNAMGVKRRSNNLYYSLSQFLINGRTPERLNNSKVENITQAWLKFLQYTTDNAEAITDTIEH